MDFSKFIEFHSTIFSIVVAVVGITLVFSFITPVPIFPINSECTFTDYASLWTLSIVTVCVAILCYLGTLYIIPLLPHPSVETPRPPVPRRVLILSLIDSVLMLAALIMSMICLGKAVEIKIAKVVCLPLVGKVMIFILPHLIFLLGGHALWYTYIDLFRSSTTSVYSAKQSFDNAHVHEID